MSHLVSSVMGNLHERQYDTNRPYTTDNGTTTCRCNVMTFAPAKFRQKASYAIFRNSNHVPAARKTMPEARAIQRPNRKSFSKRMSNARSTIQSTFITPPTNKSAISTQQQPMQ